MLNIYRRINVDAGLKQCFYVLPALGVHERPLVVDQVRVCQFIDDDELRLGRQGTFKIEFQKLASAVVHRPLWKNVQTEYERLCLRSRVRLDVADDDIYTFLSNLASRLQHGVRLADAWGSTKEDFQFAAVAFGFFRLNAGQKLIGVRTGVA